MDRPGRRNRLSAGRSGRRSEYRLASSTVYAPISTLAVMALIGSCLGAPEPYPTRPEAHAGTDTFGDVGQPVPLDGTASSSPRDGAELTYDWSFDTVPDGSLLNSSAFDPNGTTDAANTAFVPDLPGRYVVRLDVSDGTASSIGDFVVVDVGGELQGPIANAGADQNVTEGMAVYLDGTQSTDPSGAELYYRWSLEGAPALSALTSDDIVNRYTPYPSLVVDAGGLFTLSLVVSNGDVVSSPDYVFIQVASTNTPPVADAGEDRTVSLGETAVLDGSNSFDANGDPLTYAWTMLIVPVGSSLPTGTFPGTAGATVAVTPDVPGRYVVELVVSDGEAKGEPDVVTVTAVAVSD